LPLKYVSYQGEFYSFKDGLNATAMIIDSIEQTSQGLRQNPFGAVIYISPRVMRGYLAQKYLLDDPFNNFPNFQIIHTEDSLIVSDLKQRGLNVGEFVSYYGLQGPIKIWQINYIGNEEIKQEYLDTNSDKYLSWEL
jgi:hypothetical protein